MSIKLFGVDISFSFWFFAVVLAALSTGRGALALYMLLPIAIHECGHLIAMLLCGIRIEAVSFTAFSIDIRRGESATARYGKDIVAALGGILANLAVAGILYFFAFQSLRVMFLIAVNIAVAIFNLAPIANLDGGQVLRLVMERFGSVETAYRISRLCSFLLLIPLFAAAILFLLRREANVSLLLVCVYLAGAVIFADA